MWIRRDLLSIRKYKRIILCFVRVQKANTTIYTLRPDILYKTNAAIFGIKTSPTPGASFQFFWTKAIFHCFPTQNVFTWIVIP